MPACMRLHRAKMHAVAEKSRRATDNNAHEINTGFLARDQNALILLVVETWRISGEMHAAHLTAWTGRTASRDRTAGAAGQGS